MAFKLTPMNIGLAVLGIFVLIALVMGVRASQKNNFQMDPYGEYVVGGVEDHIQDYNDNCLKSKGNKLPCEDDDCAKRGADRANGYGVNYHIVGDKCYECSNDPNDLMKPACNFDDYSQWQTDDLQFKDFQHNPIYGKGSCNSCGLKEHDRDQNPYLYRELGCRCCANPKQH